MLLLLLPSDILAVILAACTVFELPTLAATCQHLQRTTGERRRKIAMLKQLPLSHGPCYNPPTRMTPYTYMYLRKYLSDDGVVLLIDLCTVGALPRLVLLSLEHCHISNEGMVKLSAALTTGVLPQLDCLALRDNQIGDAGIIAFISTFADGALAQLTVSSHLTALSPHLETWHTSSPGLTVLFDVPYMPYAGPLAHR